MKKLISVSLEPDMVSFLTREAEINYRTLSSQIRMMLEEYMIEHKLLQDKRNTNNV